MKKIICIFCLLFTLFSTLYANVADNLKEITLENGLSVFLLPDQNDALVRIEFSVRAGFSSQTKSTNGFFKLYSNIIKNYSSSLAFSNVECNADSTRYSITIPSGSFYQTLDYLSSLIFAPNFTDELIKKELNNLKKEVSAAAQDSSTLINAGIDSKVFSDSPWKHDSGIYPALLKQISTSQARTILKQISDNWYTPQNSAIFISGNFSIEEAEQIVNNTFGRFYSNAKQIKQKKSVPTNKKRKFVIHDSDFSDEFAQIVVQYTMLNLDECNIAAILFNNDFSTLKQSLLMQKNLNIIGDEYINIAAANKKDCSRLIIQTLFQKFSDKNSDKKSTEKSENKTNISTIKQINTFLSTLKNNFANIDSREFSYAQHQLTVNKNTNLFNAQTFMENLCSYWAFQSYDAFDEQAQITDYSSSTVNQFFSQYEKAKLVSHSNLQDVLNAEEPFVFVIINSNDFKKNKKDYIDAGFEEINSKNANWYLQEYYKNKKDDDETDSFIDSKNLAALQENDYLYYYKNNASKIKAFQLSNGMNVVTKHSPNTTGVSILLSINGGKYNSKSNNGFEEVMLNLLASNIKKEISRQISDGIILGSPVVSTDCALFTGTILTECASEDFDACCKAISNALVYGEISPAQADRAVTSRQYKKRLENGTSITQLFDEGIKELYKNDEICALFDSKNEILTKTNYNEILNDYPLLLDASRYSVIITGNFSNQIEQTLEHTIGLLNSTKLSSTKINFPKADFPAKKSVKVKINHTFLTDIPAEKAGPMPAVLIPTTEFLDPVMYFIKAPDFCDSSDSSFFNALLCHFQNILQKELDDNETTANCSVLIQLPQPKMNFGTIIIQNAKLPKEVDVVYKAAYKKLCKDFSEDTNSENLETSIKNAWILSQFQLSSTNNGTAKLLQKGFEYSPAFSRETGAFQKASFYLEEYNKICSASRKDFELLLPSFETPSLVVSSEF